MTPGPGTPQPKRVVLALGSNLGDRLASLQHGIDALFDAPGLEFVAVSGVYETAPEGGPEQPDYLNAVLLAAATQPARAVLERCLEAETQLGRVRTLRWGPRTLDVDIIVYGDQVSDDPGLTIPHPRAHQRGFVLVPWHEVDPAASLPGHGAVADLAASAGAGGVRRLAGARLRPPARPGG